MDTTSQNILVYIIVTFATVALFFRYLKRKRKSQGCSSHCGCSQSKSLKKTKGISTKDRM